MSRTDIDLAALIRDAQPLDGDTPPSSGDNGPAQLPEEFWQARPQLAHIRQAAWSRRRAPDALLHVVLSRVGATISHTIEIPAIVGAPSPLCHFPVVLAPSGGGKTGVVHIAAQLLPASDTIAQADRLPIGSGEGLVEALFDWVNEEDEDGKKKRVKRQVRHNAFIYVDEGATLAAIGGRSGSTLLPTIRSAWSGTTLGNTNASEERRRIVPAGTHTYGIVVGIQTAHAGALLNDVDAGTPQRFTWVSAIDPNIPDQAPDWPGPLRWQPPDPGQLDPYTERGNWTRHPLHIDPVIRDDVITADLARQRGQHHLDPLDGHSMLIQLRVAALLAILNDQLDITQDDWHLAQHVMHASNTTRNHVQAVVAAEANRRETQTRQRLAGRAVATDTAVTRNQTDQAARALWRKVSSEPGITARCLQQRCSDRQRDVFNDAITHAKDMGWLIETHEPGQGDDKRTLHPGTETPR
jgi:hypothetical protein